MAETKKEKLRDWLLDVVDTGQEIHEDDEMLQLLNDTQSEDIGSDPGLIQAIADEVLRHPPADTKKVLEDCLFPIVENFEIIKDVLEGDLSQKDKDKVIMTCVVESLTMLSA